MHQLKECSSSSPGNTSISTVNISYIHSTFTETSALVMSPTEHVFNDISMVFFALICDTAQWWFGLVATIGLGLH